jgi:hypothetical protein
MRKAMPSRLLTLRGLCRMTFPPLTPPLSLVTLANCTFIIVGAFCICCTYRPVSCTSRPRSLQMVRTARICSGGRKQWRNSP